MTYPNGFPESGEISMSTIAAGFESTAPHSLSDYYGADQAGWTDPDYVVSATDTFINIGVYLVTDGASDTNSNYSVSEVQVNATGSYRLYVAHKATSDPTYFSDAPIAAIQILNSSGTTVLHQYYFGTNGNNAGWQSTPDGYAAGDPGISQTPSDAASYSYSNITTNGTADTFGMSSNTGSSQTGAVDGIASPTGPMSIGQATIPQASNTYYVYREASGSVLNQAAFMRGPSITWTDGMIVRIAYIIGNTSSGAGQQQVNDTLFIGLN